MALTNAHGRSCESNRSPTSTDEDMPDLEPVFPGDGGDASASPSTTMIDDSDGTGSGCCRCDDGSCEFCTAMAAMHAKMRAIGVRRASDGRCAGCGSGNARDRSYKSVIVTIERPPPRMYCDECAPCAECGKSKRETDLPVYRNEASGMWEHRECMPCQTCHKTAAENDGLQPDAQYGVCRKCMSPALAKIIRTNNAWNYEWYKAEREAWDPCDGYKMFSF